MNPQLRCKERRRLLTRSISVFIYRTHQCHEIRSGAVLHFGITAGFTYHFSCTFGDILNTLIVCYVHHFQNNHVQVYECERCTFCYNRMLHRSRSYYLCMIISKIVQLAECVHCVQKQQMQIICM